MRSTLSAACNGSPSSTTGGSSNAGGSANSKALAYARCVRSHGVPDFPDPNSNGNFVLPSSSVSSQETAANQVCYHLLTSRHSARAPWPVVIMVSCLPVVVFGFGAALTHLLRAPASESGAGVAAARPVSVPVRAKGPVLADPVP